MGVSPARLFPRKPRSKMARVWSGPPVTFPELACPLWPGQPHPHSSWISGIKRHSMCGQAEGAARSGAGWQESRGRHPPPTPPRQTPALCSPDTAPAAHGQTPPTRAGTATPRTPRRPLTWTLLGEREAPSAWRGAWWPPDCWPGPPSPLAPWTHVPPYLSTAP